MHERAHCEFKVAHIDALVGRVNRIEQFRRRVTQRKETVGDRPEGLPQEVGVGEARAELGHEQRTGLELLQPLVESVAQRGVERRARAAERRFGQLELDVEAP